MIIAVVVQLESGEGVLVRVNPAAATDDELVEVDVRDQEHHSWTPVRRAKSALDRAPKYRVEIQ